MSWRIKIFLGAYVVCCLFLFLASPVDFRNPARGSQLVPEISRWFLIVRVIFIIFFQGLIFQALRRKNFSWRWIYGAALFIIFIAIIIGPRLSADTGYYYLTGKLAGQNVNLYAPWPEKADFLNGLQTDWWNTQYLYGPLWRSISALASSAGFSASVLIFSALGALGFMGGILLLINALPISFYPIIALMALNPMLITEFVANGHNDWLIFFLSCLAIWLMKRGHRILAGFLPIFAFGVKFPGLLITPFSLLAGRKKGKDFFPRLILFLLLIFILIGPVWGGMQEALSSFAARIGSTNLSPLPFFLRGFNDLIINLADFDIINEIGFKAVFWAGLIFFLAGASVLLFRFLNKKSLEENGQAQFLLILLFLFTLGNYQQPWYLTLLFPWIIFSKNAQVWLVGLPLVWALSYVHLGWAWLLGLPILFFLSLRPNFLKISHLLPDYQKKEI